MNDTISVIDIATGRITRRYGHPGVAGPRARLPQSS
jgi:hypothetical protein